MSYAVFVVQREAEAFSAAVDASEGLPKPGDPVAPFDYGWTLHWASLIAHPDGTKWAYPLAGCPLPAPGGAQIVDALTPDWFPPGPFT